MSDIATVFGPEPVLDETRYAVIITAQAEGDDEYNPRACMNGLYLFKPGIEMEEAYQQATALLSMHEDGVKAFVCEVFVKDQLV